MPAHRVALVLRLGCGSLHEEDDERGLAHLLEHLAFRGSRHFPPRALPAFFQSLGTRLGQHHNASTSFDHTRFALSLPHADEAAIDRGLQCLADFAYGLELAPASVASEAQVVLEEMRARQDGDARLRGRLQDALLADPHVRKRHPLGSAEVIRAADPAQVAAFYRRHYRPDTAWLVIAGDFAADVVDRRVSQHFSAWPVPPHPPAERRLQTPAAHARAEVVSDPRLGEAEAALLWLRPVPRARTGAELRALTVSGMALGLAQRRLERAARAGAPFRAARIAAARQMLGWGSLKVLVSGDEARLREMVSALVGELGAVLADGFDQAELELATSAALSAAQEAIAADAERGPDAVAEEIEDATIDDRVVLSARQRLAHLEATLPGVTPQDLADGFRVQVRLEVPLLFAAVPGHGPVPSAEELLRLVSTPLRGRARVTTAEVPAQLLKAVPPVVPPAEHDEPEPDAVDAWLANGVRLRCRRMEGGGRVFVQAALFGGRIRETETQLGLTSAAALSLLSPATEELSTEVLGDYMAARRLALQVGVDEDCVRLGFAVRPERLRPALELLHVLLVGAVVHPPSLERWRAERLADVQRQGVSLELAVAAEALRLLSGDDPRFRLLGAGDLVRLTPEPVDAWLRTLVRSPLHVAIVGDVATAEAFAAGSAYLGSLPARPRRDPLLAGLRVLAPQPGPLSRSLSVRSDLAQASVLCGYRATSWNRTPERHWLALAETIAGERLQLALREARGLTYTALCSLSASRAYPAASLFSATLLTAPESAPEALAATREELERLAREGPSEAELVAARDEFGRLAQRAAASPGIRARVLAEADERGVDVAHMLALPKMVAACTANDVASALREIVCDARRIEVTATGG